MKKYPYIQNEQNITSGVCWVCKEIKPIKRIEWRVNWFQGDCEFENICLDCLNERKQKEKAKQEAYEKKMEPVWERQMQKQKNRENVVKGIISELGLSLQEFGNGQWCIGGKLDWWTTTGTAIERKSRKRHYFSFKEPEIIKNVLAKLKD